VRQSTAQQRASAIRSRWLGDVDRNVKAIANLTSSSTTSRVVTPLGVQIEYRIDGAGLGILVVKYQPGRDPMTAALDAIEAIEARHEARRLKK
jgi:hypothetical protein